MFDDIPLAAMDWMILLGTLAVSLFIGFYYACIDKQKTGNDLLVGGRDMSVLPIALSLLATYMSAILVLGYAGEIYSHGTLITEMVFGTLFYIPFSAFLFLSTLYKLELTSAYEYLELRFESKYVRYLATITFIFQIVMYMGVVIFAPALAIHSIMGLPVWLSILIIGVCAALYTSIGGIKAVVWTDAFQILMMFAGMLAVIIQGAINVGGLGNIYTIAKNNGRIEYLNFKVDPTRLTSLNIFFGQGALWLSMYGCHQSTVQRYCSLRSLKRARVAIIITGPLVAFTLLLGSLSGLAIFANYAGCDPLTLGLIQRNDQIAPHFVTEFLSKISGLAGLFISCLLCGALSSVSSGLNSLAAVTWEDFLKDSRFMISVRTSEGTIIKLTAIVYGIISIGMGFVAQNLGGVLTAALVVNGALAGPLLGVFTLGIMLPFSNKKGAIVGMLVAHFITLWISMGGLFFNKEQSHLPFRIDECSNATLSSVNMTEVYKRQNYYGSLVQSEMKWEFMDIYEISFTLYPLIGALTTIIVGSIVSLITGPTTLTADNQLYCHPNIVRLTLRLRRIFGSSKDTVENYLGFEQMEVLRDGMTSGTFRRRGSDVGSTATGWTSKLSYDNPAFQPPTGTS